tara:strand:+ start:6 stop:1193 length:1188 start_codon:yes stop_codon:yes gene_type:complete
MLHKLIDHSPDLKRLRDEGYEIQIRGAHVLIGNIPYVNSNKGIEFGTIVSELTIAGNKAGKPNNHVVFFIGEQPCHKDGTEIAALIHGKNKTKLADGIEIDRSFSNKPSGGYTDYYQKFTTYIKIISAPAQSIDNSLTAQTFKLIDSVETDSPFNYPDTNSSRAEIVSISDKLKNQKIGIIGVGGTGSYLLDFIAKTPVDQIHIFDNDEFVLHNAFRAPGAPDSSVLKETPIKVNYYCEVYGKMHKGIVPHPVLVTKDNLSELDQLDFVFICVDNGQSKKSIIDHLIERKKNFIDVGMGIEITDDNSLLGLLRITSGISEKMDHILTKDRIPFVDGEEEDEYSKNIQIAELNALNAVLAVIKWKKHCGFYHQAENEKHSLYSIDDNSIINEDIES